MNMTEPQLTNKRVAIIPFPGGRLEVRNASDYPLRDANGQPTGQYGKARAGVFLCLPGGDACDISSIPLDEILHPELFKKFNQNKLVQSILKENEQAALKAA